VLLDNSRAEQQAGFNVSYENSFSAIKRDIMRETVDTRPPYGTNPAIVGKSGQVKPKLAINLQFETIDEKIKSKGVGSTTSGNNTNKSMTAKLSVNEYLAKANPNQYKNNN
jgi:hypothetical protein